MSIRLINAVSNVLESFELRASDDPVKRDLELVCTQCGERLCDAEHGDTLGVLVHLALKHEHKVK